MGESFKFSKMAETGTRVPRKTHAPLTLPAMLSTAGHFDQSAADLDVFAAMQPIRQHWREFP